MYQELHYVAQKSEIWRGERKHSHAFLLSPSVYRITREQEQELQQLGFALYDCLLGLSQIAVIAYDRSLNYHGAWTLARRVFSSGVPKIYQELQGMHVRRIPRLIKVDLMVDHAGRFRIAEIDGHNKHGLGYSTLARQFRNAVEPDASGLPGAVALIAAEMQRLGHRTIKLLYADQERFYVPEFEIAQEALREHGMDCVIMPEMEADAAFVSDGLFLDLPFLHHRTNLYAPIIEAYKKGDVEFLIPPKPFLGAKGVLALLRNDGKDPQLEAILGAFIDAGSLALARSYIPETLLVGRHAEPEHAVRARTAQKRYVLKESISSGMKGTIFSDEPDFPNVLSRASAGNLNWVLQEEVANQPQTFSWYEHGAADGTRSLKTADDWFMRVTAHYVNRALADIVVTARRDKAVHGAKDCIQIGTVVA